MIVYCMYIYIYTYMSAINFTLLQPPGLTGPPVSAYSPPSTSVFDRGILFWKAVCFRIVFPGF